MARCSRSSVGSGSSDSGARLSDAARTALVFLVTTLAWVPFRAADFGATADYFGRLCGFVDSPAAAPLLAGLLGSPYLVLSFALAALVTWAGRPAWTWTRELSPARAAAALDALRRRHRGARHSEVQPVHLLHLLIALRARKNPDPPMTPLPAPIDPSSREAEARAEIAATRVGRGVAWTLVALPAALLLFALALEVGALARGESRLTGPLPSSISGSATGLRAFNARLLAVAREIEDRFDEESTLARAIRPWGQLALTAALGYGNEEAYVGRDGSLVYRADFDHLTVRGGLAALGAGDPLAGALAFAQELAQRGIPLLVLPVPAKPSIQPEGFALGAVERPLASPRDRSFRESLAASREAPHLLDPSALLASRVQSAPAYLARDTHWRPEAMDMVARELAMRLRALASLPAGQPEQLEEAQLVVEGGGDSEKLLGLPAALPFYAKQAVELRAVRSAAGGPWRPTRGAPVLLLGDSFAAIYSQPELGFGASAGLAERLSFHLGLPVDRILENAGGASATRAALARELERDPHRLDGVRVVVWQFAARELTIGDWRETPLPQAPPLFVP